MALSSDLGGSSQATEPTIELLPLTIEDVVDERCPGTLQGEGVLVGRQDGHTESDQRDMGRMGKRQELIVQPPCPSTLASSLTQSLANVSSYIGIELFAYFTSHMGVHSDVR